MQVMKTIFARHFTELLSKKVYTLLPSFNF